MNLFDFLQGAVSSFHTAKQVKEILFQNNFEELSLGDEWQIERGKRYFVAPYETCVFAFGVGAEMEKGDGIRIAAAHGDFPGFYIKPNPELAKEGYQQLNTEVYGGVNLSSWMDRPLSVAGAVSVRSEDAFHPSLRLIDIKEPLFIIPSLAIHLNREVNKGVEIKSQTEMLPIVGMSEECDDKQWFISYIAEHLGVQPEDILDYKLQIYNADLPQAIGKEREFISAPRLDNLTSVFAITKALCQEQRSKGINVSAIFDHEEVGSRTKEGAGSVLLPQILEKIYLSLGYSPADYISELSDSILLSVDVSQGYHPAYSGKFDPTNHSVLGQGFSIKQACRQSYVTDCMAVGIIKQICDKEEISYQNYLNHSDVPGGSTLGAIAIGNIPVRGADIGVPMLSMHSARELIHKKDQENLENMLQAYFSL